MKRLSPSPSLLEDCILALAETFTRDLLVAVQRSSLHELRAAADAPSPAGARATPAPKRRVAKAVKARKRRVRSANRAPAEIARLVDRIVRAVTDAAPHALSGGELRAHLGLTQSAFARPIREAVASGRIATQGKGRLTQYVSARVSKRTPPRRTHREPSDRAPTRAAEATPDDDALPPAHEATETDV